MNPEARSPVGALGLMQLMPATGRNIARKLNSAISNLQQLLVPETNIRFGSYYRLVEDVSLRESNAVFVVNGRVFRKPATLLSTHHLATSYSTDTLVAAERTFIQEGVTQFSTHVGIVDPSVPSIAPATVRIAPGTASADNPTARAAMHHPDSWERKWNAPFYTANQYTPTLMRKGRIVLQGTVARITQDGTLPNWLRIYFKEAPDAAVTVCTASPDIFDEFGTNYRGLIGRTLRAVGDIGGLCKPAGIQITQSNQFAVDDTEPAVP